MFVYVYQINAGRWQMTDKILQFHQLTFIVWYSLSYYAIETGQSFTFMIFSAEVEIMQFWATKICLFMQDAKLLIGHLFLPRDAMLARY